MPTPSYDAFLSYRSSDLTLAEALYQRLTAAGFAVWFDKARLHPGCDWHGEIEAGRDASRVVLPVLTPEWQASPWCLMETYGGEQVIALLCAGEWHQVAPAPLHRYQHFDCRVPDAAPWERLFAALRDLLRRPRPDKAARLAHLPAAHNRHFVGREQELLQIHECLRGGGVAALTQVPTHALAGLGGVGKTTLARAYAEMFWQQYEDVL